MTDKRVKAWYFRPDRTSVQLIRTTCEYEDLQRLLHTTMVEWLRVSTPSGMYVVTMDEEGCYKREHFNEAATKVLRKLLFNWPEPILRGYYLVYREEEEYDEEYGGHRPMSMPEVGFKEWIAEMNAGIIRASQATAAFFASMEAQQPGSTAIVTLDAPPGLAQRRAAEDAAPVEYTCQHCRRSTTDREDMYECCGCQDACYCGPDCQQSDWTSHRSVCRSMRKAASIEVPDE